MPLVSAADLVRRAAREAYAVPAFPVWDSVTMQTVLDAAEQCRAPVIMMCGGPEFALAPPRVIGAVARAVAEAHDVPAALHLDHGRSPEVARECIAAGFTSVMLDYSDRPFADNVAALRALVEQARPAGVTVEGEIGAVGRADDVTAEGSSRSGLTAPDEARAYAEQTGVDMLAVAIGNGHGIYKARPHLEFTLLAELREAAGVPLVLHGGSGTPEQDVRRAVSLGMAKVNVASELVRAARQSLEDQWTAGRGRWLPIALKEAMAALAEVARRWFRVTGAEGRAGRRA
jgi:tagatose 1,6-diphosphate aldolase GatY/KbaY